MQLYKVIIRRSENGIKKLYYSIFKLFKKRYYKVGYPALLIKYN